MTLSASEHVLRGHNRQHSRTCTGTEIQIMAFHCMQTRMEALARSRTHNTLVKQIVMRSADQNILYMATTDNKLPQAPERKFMSQHFTACTPEWKRLHARHEPHVTHHNC
eukprot:6157697-Amphidinium_carterae.5